MSTAIATVIKMMESLPENVQSQVVGHLREHIQDIQDDLAWDNLFQNTQIQLVLAAKKARQEINEGKAKPLDINML
ncbi:MAG TPA: hypothetical protein V6C58_23400 [Allocoleopsis sp.]